METIRNETFIQRLNIKVIEDCVEESQLRQFGHSNRIKEDRTTRKVYDATSINRTSKRCPEKYGRKK